MNIKKTFTIQFGIRAISKDGSTDYKDILELALTEEELYHILFRFSPSAFQISDYKALFRYAGDNVHDLVLVKDDYTYIVTNLNQVFNQCYDEFKKMIISEKIFNIINFDYDALGDLLVKDNIEDEFGENN